MDPSNNKQNMERNMKEIDEEKKLTSGKLFKRIQVKKVIGLSV